jgi:AraC family transcriptional regulator
MPDPVSHLEYESRINRALDYVQANLDRDLGLEALAREACFSPWHFHRIFSALVGETPDAYVRRVRLEKAASWLGRQPPDSVTEIAMRCGFSTPSLFSRNFRTHFGLSPVQWRDRHRQAHAEAESKIRQVADNNETALDNDSTSLGKPGHAHPPAEWYLGNGKENGNGPHARIEVTVRRLEPMNLAYVWHLKGYRHGVADSFRRIQSWMRARELLSESSRYIGVNFDNPDVTPEQRCRMLAAISLPAGVAPESLKPVGQLPVGFTTLAGGLHACWDYQGDGRDMRDGYYQFYGHWLPDSGFVPADAPGFMVSRRAPALDDEAAIDCTICVPVAPL